MRRPRARFGLRGLMAAVALAALSLAVGRAWRVRQSRLEAAAPHALQEAFYAGLARDIAGDPRPRGATTATALLPDGTAVQFKARGSSRRPHYPPGCADPADGATVARLVAMCEREAAYHAGMRRYFERGAARPWLLAGPPPFPLRPE